MTETRTGTAESAPPSALTDEQLERRVQSHLLTGAFHNQDVSASLLRSSWPLHGVWWASGWGLAISFGEHMPRWAQLAPLVLAVPLAIMTGRYVARTRRLLRNRPDRADLDSALEELGARTRRTLDRLGVTSH